MDGEWKFFSEGGLLTKINHYKKGKLNGLSTEYYPSGNIHTQIHYQDGLREGNFEIFYDDKHVMQKGFMKKGQAEGSWETYYENGQLSSKGNFSNNEPSGLWAYWSDAGVQSQESFYEPNGTLKLLNTWDTKGKPVIVNGRGTFQIVSDDNKIIESGSIDGGLRIGMWEKRFVNGRKLETGEYRDGKYFLNDVWSPQGQPLVIRGEGVYESFYPKSGAKMDSGAVSNGLRTGKWVTYFENTIIPMRITHYTDGNETGEQTNYSGNGVISHTGRVENGKRHGRWTWYAPNGGVESTVTYKDGEKEGNHEYFDPEDGKLLRWEKYGNGQLIEVNDAPQ
jgi:antitoxin component YwqK of YwqJK toxin-antitoxin module